jgi:urea transport system permease protein
VVPSIAFVIGVAIGGRATLFGPVLGAIAVAWAQTALSESFPSFWSYFQGALFVLVIAFLPGGLAALVGRANVLRDAVQRRLRVGARVASPSVASDTGNLVPPEPGLSGIRAGSETGQ